MTQWTYAYWDSDSFLILHQAPDPKVQGRVQSTVIAKGAHCMVSPAYGDPAYSQKYADVQRQLGEPYATEEWPLRTCVDFAVKQD